MSKVFISHSSKDKATVEKLMDFLILGCGIHPNDIFCTELVGTLPSGTHFMDQIKFELRNAQKIICLITQNYLNSMTCMVELGAAWFQTDKLIPLIVEPVRYSTFNNTPLMGVQMLKYNSSEDLTALYQELCREEIADKDRLVEFNRQLNRYIELLPKKELIQPNQQGYYCATITEKRNTPPMYRCYKLNEVIALSEEPVENETHWIFYKAGMYADLNVGDTVLFSVESTELRQFKDLKNARNIYPSDLRKVSN